MAMVQNTLDVIAVGGHSRLADVLRQGVHDRLMQVLDDAVVRRCRHGCRRRRSVLASPPSKPVSAIVDRPWSRAHVSARTMFGERPEDEIGDEHVAGPRLGRIWYANTSS